MRRITVFNNQSLDGYFASQSGDMSWAYPSADEAPDPEWTAFVSANASGSGELLFGRITYEQMLAFWPTPAAYAAMPEVARGMADMRKTVISRTLVTSSWANTVFSPDLLATTRRLKAEDGPDIAILGSGSIVAQLAQQSLVDEYQVVTCPIALGAGRTQFDGLAAPVRLTLQSTRSFRNGRVFSRYAVL